MSFIFNYWQSKCIETKHNFVIFNLFLNVVYVKQEISPSVRIFVTIRRHRETEHGLLLPTIDRIVFCLDVEAIGEVPGWRSEEYKADEETPEKFRQPHPASRIEIALDAPRTLCHRVVVSLLYMRNDRKTREARTQHDDIGLNNREFVY